jgi:hypothetical protein
VFSKRPKEILAFTVNLGSPFVRDPNSTDGWLGHRAVHLCAVLTCVGAGMGDARKRRVPDSRREAFTPEAFGADQILVRQPPDSVRIRPRNME